MILSRFLWYRKLRGGKWGVVSGFFVNKKWIKLPNEAIQYDEFWQVGE